VDSEGGNESKSDENFKASDLSTKPGQIRQNQSRADSTDKMKGIFNKHKARQILQAQEEAYLTNSKRGQI
jgi:hypothetical protein